MRQMSSTLSSKRLLLSKQVTAIESFNSLFALLFLPTGELGLLLVVGNLIVASHARIAFL
jgi:hypothetical protein